MIICINGLNNENFFKFYMTLLSDFDDLKYFVQANNGGTKFVEFDGTEPMLEGTKKAQARIDKFHLVWTTYQTEVVFGNKFVYYPDGNNDRNSRTEMVDPTKDMIIGPYVSDELIEKLKARVGASNVVVYNIYTDIMKGFKLFRAFNYAEVMTSKNNDNISDRLDHFMMCHYNTLKLASKYGYIKYDDLLNGKKVKFYNKEIQIFPDWYVTHDYPEYDEFLDKFKFIVEHLGYSPEL